MVAAKSQWKGHNLLHISRFKVDEVCRLATIASCAYHAAARERQNLADLGVDSKAALCNLKLLNTVLNSLPSLELINIEFVNRACRENQLEAAIIFFGKCKEFAITQQGLARILVDVTDQNWPSRLRKLNELCKHSGFDTLDIDVLRQQNRTYINLNQFIENFPDSISFGISELKKAKQLIDQTSRRVLALRAKATADPEAGMIVEQAIRRGRELREQRDKMQDLFAGATNVSSSNLSAYLDEIAGSSFLSFFSRGYRQAKFAYLSISNRASFEKERAVKDIRSLIEWKESEQGFFTDHRIVTAFGPHFRGVDTDFCLFEQLLSFYKDVEQKFPGIANHKMREFLKTADLDSLISLPEIDNEMNGKIFDNLGSCTEHINLYLSNFEQALEKLVSLTRGLKDSASIRVRSINELELRVGNHFQVQNFLDNNSEMKNLLGDHFDGAKTAWQEFETDISAAQEIMSAQFDFDPVLDILTNGTISKALTVIQTVIQRDLDAEGALSELSQYAKIDTTHFSDNRSHSEIAEFLDAASKDQSGLYAHSAWATARGSLGCNGFNWVATSLLRNNLPLDNLGNILEAIVIRALGAEVANVHGSTLSNFKGESLDILRDQLAAADKKIIKLSCIQIRAKAHQSASPPGGIGVGARSSWTDMALIHNEIRKSQRFISIRDLTERAGRALLELKPCWMMSPLAVAQYLPRGNEAINFDLCIIDEASQMPPEDSIGALARSCQAVVVGDTNQLPPTNFFRTLIDDENADEDETILSESILEMANAAFRPPRRLRWHYRSRHSALIKFSNRRVYEDDLIVFPAANESREDMGVSLTYVPQGLYSSGINIVEADTMIQAALDFMHTRPDRSLGLVTMNQKQRDLLYEGMYYHLNKNSHASNYIDKWEEEKDGLESFFIKNLENVQGDERDVIFIGTVYGPEQLGGAVMQRFGPINHVAGKRRLNVLFTRAREKIVTFSSMKAGDIRADEHTNPGAHMLKCWLEYSVTGILDTGIHTHREPDSDFEIFVINQIKSMGCEPVPQVGVKGYFIDIGVQHPKWPYGFIMGVECDGRTYHSSPSARDRDRLRQEVLEGLDWHLYRIWSTDWFRNPREAANNLRRAINTRLAHLMGTQPNL